MLVADQLVGAAVVPLNVMVLAPLVAPKFVPATVTGVPMAPLAGERLVMLGVGSTVNVVPELGTPSTVTTTLPVVAPAGTGTTMLVADQLVGDAVVPLNVMVLAPFVAPKLVPATVTGVPTPPLAGERLVMPGVGSTANVVPVLGTPSTVMTTLPVVAPAGTGTTMLVADQVVGDASVPLNLTVLAPCVAPKLEPAIMTGVPIAPLIGDRIVMLGVGSTRNATPALVSPSTVTTTLPVVAPGGTGTTMLDAYQLAGVAGVPLKVTVLVPCSAPKSVPVMVTSAPSGPDVRDRLAMPGAGGTS
jgi:hypothetical protein